ncbi:MAG TPA: sulfatase [Phycisphaerae bacterium]|nr:sulfatase [Phycisphaerae bacterium]HOM50492.1 sulfatase [Phycisphaerae bacterium]HON66332.1 sulfatase [Phycisphaerae bacterium]HOQ87046.1 sulfatase [Phycisphaerae bacterium]HPP28265.1 sulfatase [Phycisphaerae bacterium]
MRKDIAFLAIGMAISFLRAPTHGQSATPPTQAGAKRPNVIVIVADDMGYADLGCQGAKDVRTPHIDSLAANGVRFTDGYVSCPVCSPTRAGLITGRYQQRFGHELNPPPPGQASKEGLPLTEKTMADYFKQAGYVTGAVGKWHLGYQPAMRPTRRGFDEFFGFPGGSHSYVDARADANNPILRGTEPVNEKEYLTDAFSREAVAFVNRHADKPFFLYLAYNAIHGPMQSPESYKEPYAAIADPKRQTMAGMLAAMDTGVGQLLDALRQRNIEDNTLIFFISDNGGPTAVNASRNHPFSGFKGQVLEGGIRVPFIVQFKGRIPGGKVYRQPVIALDILPTALAAAGISVPADRPLDGVNLLPYLTGEKNTAPHETLYWRFGPQAAIRRGNYKWVRRDGEEKLFDLAVDPAEQHDLSADKPQLVKELRAAWQEWSAGLAEPLWQGRRARRAPGEPRPAVPNRPAGQRRGQRT